MLLLINSNKECRMAGLVQITPWFLHDTVLLCQCSTDQLMHLHALSCCSENHNCWLNAPMSGKLLTQKLLRAACVQYSDRCTPTQSTNTQCVTHTERHFAPIQRPPHPHPADKYTERKKSEASNQAERMFLHRRDSQKETRTRGGETEIKWDCREKD